MSKRSELEQFLNPVFRKLGVPWTDLNRPNAEGRIANNDAVYAAYLYAQVLTAMGKSAISTMAVPPGVFKFRRGPSNIHTTPTLASYVVLNRNGKTYELHADTEVESRHNKAPLELDLLILPTGHANVCRKKKRNPSYRQIKLMIEAKYHKGGIGMNEAKLFVGMATGVRCKNCVDGLVSDDRITPVAVAYLTGSRPPLAPFPKVSPRKKDAATVKNFVNHIQTNLPSLL